MTKQELPPDIEKQLELMERKALDEQGPEIMSSFSTMARYWLYSVFSPHEMETKEVDGYRVTSFKK